MEEEERLAKEEEERLADGKVKRSAWLEAKNEVRLAGLFKWPRW